MGRHGHGTTGDESEHWQDQPRRRYELGGASRPGQLGKGRRPNQHSLREKDGLYLFNLAPAGRKNRVGKDPGGFRL